MARYLAMQRTCYPSKIGKLTENGLSPFKIGSLVGCSPTCRVTGAPLRRSPSRSHEPARPVDRRVGALLSAPPVARPLALMRNGKNEN